MKRQLKWLYDRYKQKIQLRLTVYFLLILLPLVVVSLFAQFRAQQVLLKQTAERTKGALTSSMDYIDLTLQNVEEISTLLATDNSILHLLEQIGSEMTPQSIVQFAELSKQLSNVMSINHIISQISIYHAGSNMLISTSKGVKEVRNEMHRERLRRFAETNGSGIVYMTPEDPFAGDDSFKDVVGVDSVSLVRALDLYNSDRQPNLLIVTLNKSRLLQLIRSVLPSNDAQIFLFSNNGKMVTGTGPGSTELLNDGAKETGMIKFRIDSRYYKWSLVMLQPEDELYMESEKTKRYTYFIIGLSVTLALLISLAVYNEIASPLQKLLQGMRAVGSGNFGFKVETRRKDEFGHLTRAFNQMVQDQKHLIETYYEQQLRLANTELKFLQSQINPHFLYNTLDSIYWAAKNYEADEISEMVIHLSRFFRLSLNKGKETFTVEETIAHLHDYVRVQQLRFLDKFSVTYDIQEETRTIPVLKLLLQPLVENAILHGLESKPEGGQLTVTSRIEGDCLVLTVKDNGVGIPRERLAYIRDELDRLAKQKDATHLSFAQEPVHDLYGLKNVMSRIKMLYGNRADLNILSAEGEGTTVTVTLPLDKCKEEFHFDRVRPYPELGRNVI